MSVGQLPDKNYLSNVCYLLLATQFEVSNSYILPKAVVGAFHFYCFVCIFKLNTCSKTKKEEQESPEENRKRRTGRAVTCPSITCRGGGGVIPSLPVRPCPGMGIPHAVLDWGVPHPDLSQMGRGVPHPDLSQVWGGGEEPCPGLFWIGGWNPILSWTGDSLSCDGWGTPPPEGTWHQWKYYGI